MAWIESHQNLGDHPKTLRAATMLRVSPAEMVGHLHFLWWWALDYAQTGDISALTAAEIASAARWTRGNTHQKRDPELFVDALLTCGPNGFLDRVDGRLQIHDWMEYAGKLIERRRKDAARKRGTPADIHGKSSGTPPQPALEGARTQQNQPTNPTEPLAGEDDLPTPVREMRDHIISKLPLKYAYDPELIDEARLFAVDYAGKWAELSAAYEQVKRQPDGKTIGFPGSLRKFMPPIEPVATGPKPYEMPEPWRDHVELSPEEQERHAEETRASLVEYKARKAASRE